MVLDVEIKSLAKINLEVLDISEIKKIKKLASHKELNIFYDRNEIIVALCNRVLELLK